MKRWSVLIVLLSLAVISCTEADRELWREVDREYKERGRECTYNHKGELIGSCDFIN
nr:hypothetical protein [uncultured Leptotrichia sp.]